MKHLLLVVVFAGSIPLAFADDQGFFEWRFCQENILFPYKIINGTIKETAHLKLYETPTCDDGAQTEFQLQIFHTSNNQTDFTLEVPDNLEFESIQVRAIEKISKSSYQAHTFWLNDTTRILYLDDYMHDQFGMITLILDLIK